MTKFKLPIFWLMYSIGWVIYQGTFRTRYVGDVKRRRGPAVLPGKHRSYWDISAISIVARRYYKTFPHFEMGTFYGYPMLGRVQWMCERYGAFKVMRAKDLIRLKHGTGLKKSELMEIMKATNDEAARCRDWVLRNGRALVYFPEGGRTNELAEFKSEHEMREAIDLVNEGLDITVQPIVPVYGKRPPLLIPFIWKRPLTVHMLAPVDIRGRTVDDVFAEIRAKMAVVLNS